MTLRNVLVLALFCLPAPCSTAFAAAPSSPTAVRDNEVRALMLTSYVDGVDELLAHQLLRDDDAPRLAQLLTEPDFARKDNLVAFLGYLDHPAGLEALLRFAAAPLAPRSVDELRARTLVRQALEQLDAPRRGADAEIDRDAESAPIASRRVNTASSALVPDPASRASMASLTYANHVAVEKPMTDERIDRILATATDIAGRSDFGKDVSCCFLLQRSGNAQSFGIEDDGLDEIETQAELDDVLEQTAARVKIVQAINFCNGRKRSNVLGCSTKDGASMVLVRMNLPADEAVLWLHELGRNAGLGVSSDGRNVMAAIANATNRGLTTAQCAALQALPDGNGLVLTDAGACEDPDQDGVHTLIDNCPSLANPGQGDLDLDGTGDFCEDGSLAPISPESEVSSFLDEPLEFSWTRGAAQIQMELQFSADPEFKRSGKIVGTGFNFFPNDVVTPTIAFWQEALRLGKGEAPVYWRIRGKRSDGKVERQPQTPRAVLVSEPLASTVTGELAECAAPTEACTFDIDRKDSPTLRWLKNHNQRYRVTFAGNPEFTGKTFTPLRNYTLLFTAWKIDGATWDKLRKEFWQTDQTVEIWYRIEARDALDRQTTSPPARLFMADLPEPPPPPA